MCVNHFTHLNHPTMLRLVCSFYLHFSVNSLSLCSSLSGLSSPCCIPRFFLEKVHVGGQDIHSIYLVHVNNISYEMSSLKSKSWIRKWGKYTQWASSAACLDLKFNLRTDFYSIFMIVIDWLAIFLSSHAAWMTLNLFNREPTSVEEWENSRTKTRLRDSALKLLIPLYLYLYDKP